MTSRRAAARRRAVCAALVVGALIWPGTARAREAGVFRFDDNLSSAVAVEAAAIDAVQDGLSFEFDDSLTWSPGAPSGTVGVSGGALVLTTRSFGSVVSPDGLGIDPYAIEAISIRMRVVGSDLVALMWKPEQAGRFLGSGRFNIRVPKQGEWFTYTLRTAGLREWHWVVSGQGAGRNRRISGLRIDVAGDARLEVDFLRLLTARSFFVGSLRGVTQHRIDQSTRTALYTHCPGSVTYQVTVPEHGRFSAEIAVVDARPPVAFSVELTSPERAVTVAREVVDSNDRWRALAADLSGWAGRELRVTLRAECERPGNVAFWADPVLYRSAPEAGVGGGAGGPATRPRPRNVLVYLIDALRADHLEAYGYHRNTAPAIARLARAGARFTRFFAQDTWTKPSVSTLLTGVSELAHGAQGYGDTVPDALILLPEMLRRSGVATAAVTENNHVGEITNLARGFSRLEGARFEPYDTWFRAVNTVELVEQFLTAHPDRAFFLYVHTIDPHAPYLAPEPHRRRFAPPTGEPAPVDLYDGEIAAADDGLARVVSLLERLGLDQDTLLIVLADHGEAFGEHEGQSSHGGSPYNELIHVPLIITFPPLIPGGTVVAENAQMSDIAPTVCDLLGVEPAGQFQGRSLMPLIEGAPSPGPPHRTIFSIGGGTVSAIRGDWKLMATLKGDEPVRSRLFRLDTDPGETADLAGRQRAVAGVLAREIADYLRVQGELARMVRASGDRPLHLDPEAVERLRALGYVQ